MASLAWKGGAHGNRRHFIAGPYRVAFDGLVWRAYCNNVLLADDKGRTTSPVVIASKRTCEQHAAKVAGEAGIRVRAS